MVLADLVAGLVMYEEGWASWAWRTSGIDIAQGLVGLAIFTLMPAAWMFGESLTDEMGDPVTAHGHERKKVIDAVYVETFYDMQCWETRLLTKSTDPKLWWSRRRRAV